MKRVQIYVDFHLRGPGVDERTHAFKKLVLLMMLLRIFDIADFVDTQSGERRSQRVDWERTLHIMKAHKTVGG